MAERVAQVRSPEQAVDPIASDILQLSEMTVSELRDHWIKTKGTMAPLTFGRDLLLRALCHDVQVKADSGEDKTVRKILHSYRLGEPSKTSAIKSGSIIVREYQGHVHEVVVVPDGYLWQGETYKSMSVIARKITGSNWNGPRFFGIGAYKSKRDKR
jgi:Protein of unknown function (DUF2924)